MGFPRLFAALRARWCLVTVRGNSMAPTYTDGDVLLVRCGGRLRRGVPVVFRTPGETDPPFLVKRLVALAGERHPAFSEPVPPGRIAVLGDNTGRSQDSRHFGPIDTASVMGHVLHRFPARSPG
ncbi:S26 family signal peptidase [Actinoplanes sp. NPDC051861]|uniref:S26 family signal peptidase n=1 Tax=Actinoplanes sp. NPDC051861 TaxID=3155170 RepID=UPI003423A975